MEKIKSKRVIVFFTIILILIIIAGFIYVNKFQRKFYPPTQRQQNQTSLKDLPLAVCASGDLDCVAGNEKIMASKLTGNIVDYVRHQCDGPRGCITPDPASEASETASIRNFVKDSNLDLVRVTGVNPAGIIYYCSKDNRCWSIDTKNSKVANVQLEKNTSTASPSAKPKTK